MTREKENGSMTLKTHFEVGIASSLLASGMYLNYISPMLVDGSINGEMVVANTAMIIIGITAGSVYPDIDLRKSNLNSEDVDMEWENNFGHRGIVHTLINAIGLLAIFTLPALLMKNFIFDASWLMTLGISMAIGCIGPHMILDSLTPKGIMWLYPITMYRFRIPIIKNYTTERIFRILLVGLLLYNAVKQWSIGPPPGI